MVGIHLKSILRSRHVEVPTSALDSTPTAMFTLVDLARHRRLGAAAERLLKREEFCGRAAISRKDLAEREGIAWSLQLLRLQALYVHAAANDLFHFTALHYTVLACEVEALRATAREQSACLHVMASLHNAFTQRRKAVCDAHLLLNRVVNQWWLRRTGRLARANAAASRLQRWQQETLARVLEEAWIARRCRRLAREQRGVALEECLQRRRIAQEFTDHRHSLLVPEMLLIKEHIHLSIAFDAYVRVLRTLCEQQESVIREKHIAAQFVEVTAATCAQHHASLCFGHLRMHQQSLLALHETSRRVEISVARDLFAHALGTIQKFTAATRLRWWWKRAYARIRRSSVERIQRVARGWATRKLAAQHQLFASEQAERIKGASQLMWPSRFDMAMTHYASAALSGWCEAMTHLRSIQLLSIREAAFQLSVEATVRYNATALVQATAELQRWHSSELRLCARRTLGRVCNAFVSRRRSGQIRALLQAECSARGRVTQAEATTRVADISTNVLCFRMSAFANFALNREEACSRIVLEQGFSAVAAVKLLRRVSIAAQRRQICGRFTAFMKNEVQRRRGLVTAEAVDRETIVRQLTIDQEFEARLTIARRSVQSLRFIAEDRLGHLRLREASARDDLEAGWARWSWVTSLEAEALARHAAMVPIPQPISDAVREGERALLEQHAQAAAMLLEDRLLDHGFSNIELHHQMLEMMLADVTAVSSNSDTEAPEAPRDITPTEQARQLSGDQSGGGVMLLPDVSVAVSQISSDIREDEDEDDDDDEDSVVYDDLIWV